MKRVYAVGVVGTILVLLEGFFLSAFDVVVPSLLAIAILMVARYPAQPGWVVTVWLGLLLDLISMHVFGAYLALAVGMFVLARSIIGKGFEMSRFLNIGFVLTALVGVYMVWRALLLMPVGFSGGEALLLVQYGVWQIVFTWLVGFFLLRLLQGTMDI